MTQVTWTGSALRAEREKAGIKQQDLASALGMSQSMLSRLEADPAAVEGELPGRYMDVVRAITRRRALALGLQVAEDHPSDSVTDRAEAMA